MNIMKYYSATVAADGTVVLDSVAPGQYTLTVTASKSDEQPMGLAKPLAQGEITVTVPAATDPTTPIQLGEVVLKPVK